jgi:hypothetical protein
MSKVFGIFSGVVVVVMIVSFTIGSWGVLMPNVTYRRFIENLFSIFTDFPCILVILYYHHINYRPVKSKKNEHEVV